MPTCDRCGFILPPKGFSSSCTFKHTDLSLIVMQPELKTADFQFNVSTHT